MHCLLVLISLVVILICRLRAVVCSFRVVFRVVFCVFFFQAEDGIRDRNVTGVQTCALPIFLQSQGEQLTRAGNEYRWKRHDSLTIRGNKWYRHSQSKGGGPVDFVMEFFGKSFTEAVELLTGEKGEIGRASCRERV